MGCFKRAAFVIATMILMFFTAYNSIPVASAQSASEEAAKIAAEAAAKAKVAREKAEAERKEREAAELARQEAAAAERARQEAAAERARQEAAAERARQEAAAERARQEAAAERARIEAEAAERKRIDAEAAAERKRIEAEAAERKRKEAEAAAAELARKKFEASLNMVFVQGGIFTMGCTLEQGKDCNKNEKPAHQVTLSDFYIGKYEVTLAQWRVVMDPSGEQGRKVMPGSSRPDANVSWNSAQEFIKKLNEMTGGNYRLPTEAEWEYAARGGSQSQGYKYSGGDNIRDVGSYIGNMGQEGTKEPNELGIYNMSGGLSEWVYDWFGNYSGSPQTNPQGPSSGSKRVVRGGNWGSRASNTRVSSRDSLDPNRSNAGSFNNLGFRIARSSN